MTLTDAPVSKYPVSREWGTRAESLAAQATVSTGPPTASPLVGFADSVGRIIERLDLTTVALALRPTIREILVALPIDLSVPSDQQPDRPAPGAPSAHLLVTAVEELKESFAMTQEQLARYVGISPSTVMAWRRHPGVFPRHPRIPVLLQLWATVSEAREELSTDELARIVWGGRPSEGGVPGREAAELSEKLLEKVEEVGLARFSLQDDYDSKAPEARNLDEMARDEAALSVGLGSFVEPSEDPGRE